MSDPQQPHGLQQQRGAGSPKSLNWSSRPSLRLADIPASLVAISVFGAQIPQDRLSLVQSPGLDGWAIEKVFRKSWGGVGATIYNQGPELVVGLPWWLSW